MPDLTAEKGPPANAVNLKRLVFAHRGVFIASPEYNASITPLIKNAIDWISTVREGDEPQLAAFQNRVFALGAASPGRSGGMQVVDRLAPGSGRSVAGRWSFPSKSPFRMRRQPFDDMDQLADTRAAAQLKLVARRLVDYARLLR